MLKRCEITVLLTSQVFKYFRSVFKYCIYAFLCTSMHRSVTTGVDYFMLPPPPAKSLSRPSPADSFAAPLAPGRLQCTCVHIYLHVTVPLTDISVKMTYQCVCWLQEFVHFSVIFSRN